MYYSSFQGLQGEMEEVLSPKTEMEMMSLLKGGYQRIKGKEIELSSKV
jgi:hypothetical protein